jgi:hypothetical protein
VGFLSLTLERSAPWIGDVVDDSEDPASFANHKKQDNPSPFLSFDCDPDVVSGSPEPDGYVARHQHQDRPHSP